MEDFVSLLKTERRLRRSPGLGKKICSSLLVCGTELPTAYRLEVWCEYTGNHLTVHRNETFAQFCSREPALWTHTAVLVLPNALMQNLQSQVTETKRKRQ